MKICTNCEGKRTVEVGPCKTTICRTCCGVGAVSDSMLPELEQNPPAAPRVIVDQNAAWGNE